MFNANVRISKLIRWLPVMGLLAYTYYPTFVWMVDRWLARDSYYGHGFLIPLVSLYWIVRKRGALASAAVGANPCAHPSHDEGKTHQFAPRFGLAVLLASALLQLFASFFRIYFLSAFSFVFLLLGLVLFAFGGKVTKLVWFPIAFLFLMIPLPLLFISEATLRMKFFVSELSSNWLNTIGIASFRRGSYIYTPHAVVLVGDPCSGLRSFLAFLCLGFVFAYGSKLALWKKFILIVAGLPLALCSNVIRVFMMGLLAEIYGMDLIATKVVHDGGGILVFVIALACFILIRRKLEGFGVRVG